MKSSHIFWITLLAFGITVATTHAQQPDRNQRIETMKISFITEHLSLTPEEAQIFWPVFNQYEAERRAIRQQYKSRENGQQKLEFMNDSEAEQLINQEIAYQQETLNTTKKYVAEFKKILPIKKVAVLLTLEGKFSKMILERLKNSNAQGGGQR